MTGRSGNFSSTDSGCQICGVLSHSALDCCYRMDPSYQSYHHTTSSPNSNLHVRAYAARTPPTSSSILTTPPWHVDLAATNHITNDLSNLQL